MVSTESTLSFFPFTNSLRLTIFRWMDSDSDGEGIIKEGLSNILIIEGESATGKTAAVHACAAQLGFTVIEMNASHLRSTAAVKKQCSEGM